MNRAARRRWLRERAAERAAEGLPAKTPPRKSCYTAGEIHAATLAEIAAQRAELKSRRANKLTAAERAARELAACPEPAEGRHLPSLVLVRAPA